MTPLELSEPKRKEEKKTRRKRKLSNSIDGKDSSQYLITTGFLALLKIVKELKQDEEADLGQKKGKTSCGNILCGKVRTDDLGWTKKKINGSFKYLCEVCTEAYSNKQFCYYCKQIYLDKAQNNAIVDGQDWIACEKCNRWNHLKCETESGCKDIQVLTLDKKFRYYCAECSGRSNCSGKLKKKYERKKAEKSVESSNKEGYCVH